MSKVMPGTVTLTQDQLNSILASVSNIVSGKDSHLQISIDPITSNINVAKNNSKVKPTAYSKTIDRSGKQLSRDKDITNRANNSNHDRDKNNIVSRKVTPGKSKNTVNVRIENKANDNQLAKKENVDDVTDKENGNHIPDKGNVSYKDTEIVADILEQGLDERNVLNMEPKQVVTQPPPNPPPLGHLSMAERKRLQWQRERNAEEQLGVFDPWGRPGCGAPSKPVPQVSHITGTKPTPHPHQVLPTVAPHHQAPSDTTPHITTSMQTHSALTPAVPSAMRSSFTIGVETPDVNRHKSSVTNERDKWLKELEIQREEQRVMQARERASYREKGYETWADRYSASVPHPSTNTPHSLPVAMDTHTRDTAAVADGGRSQSRVSSAPQVAHMSEDMPTPSEQKSSYLHGQNVVIDPTTKNELEVIRKRQLEHQAAVMAQVDEKKREKQREKELKISEELLEEAKWRGSMATEQASSSSQQLNHREKQSNKEQQMDQMILALEQARVGAQRDRHMRRIDRLKQGGHDVQNLQATLEDDEDISSITEIPRGRFLHTPCPPTPIAAGITPRLPAPPLTSPTHNPPDIHASSHTLRDDPHETVTSPLREFGTQTEAVVMSQLPTNISKVREISDAHIQYDPRNYKDETHTNHGMQLDKITKTKPAKQKLSERPKWGYQNPKNVTAVKQSNRDINGVDKRKQSELRRAEREEQLLKLVELNRGRVPGRRANLLSLPVHREEHKTVVYSRGADPSSGGKIGKDTTERLRDKPQNTNNPIERPTERRNFLDKFTDKLNSQSDTSSVQVTSDLRHIGGHSKYNVGQTQVSSYPPIGSSPIDPGHATTNVGHNSPTLRSPRVDEDLVQQMPNAGRIVPQSPVVPAVRHRMAHRTVDNQYHDHNSHKHNFSRDETEYFHSGISEFVPFLRTLDRFDPSMAAEAMPISRETSAAINARKAYVEGQKPGLLGNEMEEIDDRKYNTGYVTMHKDPIMNPDMVTNHPTPRQDLILHQLKNLKQTLLKRRLEAESYIPLTDLVASSIDQS